MVGNPDGTLAPASWSLSGTPATKGGHDDRRRTRPGPVPGGSAPTLLPPAPSREDQLSQVAASFSTPDFYRVVRAEAGPLLKASGFRRPRAGESGLGLYVRTGVYVKDLPDAGPPPVPDRIVICFEHHHLGYSRVLGGQFRVELEVGAREDVTRLLPAAAAGRLAEHVDTRPLLSPISGTKIFPGEFLRYRDERELRLWMEWILPQLPGAAARLARDPRYIREFAGFPVGS